MKVTVLSGGVGGAKFVLGLSRAASVSDLTAIVNTGDDFRHLGLWVSPDIDTLLYSLAGKANEVLGWGRADESWNFMAALSELGGPDWFNLGDGDLAKHVLRSHRMTRGESLTAITADFARHWGIAATILPMSDNPVSTWLDTSDGPLAFQTYFVERRCAPAVQSIWFEGAETAQPAPGVIEAIRAAECIFIAPSNPWLSIDPIMSVPAIQSALKAVTVPVVCISPLVGGKAVKGPTAKLMAELGLSVDNDTIAAHYAGLISAMLHDPQDKPPSGVAAMAVPTLMQDLSDKIRVAEAALSFARALAR